MSTPDDMAAYDRLPQWARDVLQHRWFKWQAGHVEVAIRRGMITRDNVVAFFDDLDRKQARKAPWPWAS